MLALVRGQSPGARVRALGDHRFLLMARHLPGLDFDHIASTAEKRRAPAALAEPECQRIAVHVDCGGRPRVHWVTGRLLPLPRTGRGIPFLRGCRPWPAPMDRIAAP